MKKISKRSFVLFSLLFPFIPFKPSWSHPNKPNLLVVWKKKRVLALYRNSKIIKAYRIRLGSSPKGQKEQEGDGRTPEGRYHITHKNPKSNFYLSLGINFPNQSDKKRALKRGLNPGSDIFIHGLGKKNVFLHYLFDWTEGCIAVTNKEIEEIYNLVEPGTVLYIYA